MSSFTESTIEETAHEWLKNMGCQRIAFGETDKRTKTDSCSMVSLRDCLLSKLMRGEVRVKVKV